MTESFKFALTIFILFASAFIHSTAGIGFAMLAMAILSLYLSAVESAALVCACIFLMLLIVVVRFYKDINWKIMWIPAGFMALGKVIGIFMLVNLDNSLLKKLLGIVLIAFAVYFFITRDKLTVKPTPFKGALLGLFAGLIGGINNISGPFAAMYFFPSTKDKNEYYATINAAFVPAGLIGCITHIIYGNYNAGLSKYIIPASLAVALGTLLGIKLFLKIERELIAKLLYSFVAIMGFVLIII